MIYIYLENTPKLTCIKYKYELIYTNPYTVSLVHTFKIPNLSLRL